MEQLITGLFLMIFAVLEFEINVFRWKDAEMGEESSGVLDFSP